MYAILLCLLLAVFAAYVAVVAVPAQRRRQEYENSSYRRLTGNGYDKARHDRGLWGEYLLCREIERTVEDPHVLMNVYVPRADGTTSECDLVLVGGSGVWVFENKNYSGWIFGNGRQRMWTQSLNKATKERFYNPCWQNQGHVRALSAFLGLPEETFVPVVVFGEECELKKVGDCGCPVIKTGGVAETVGRIAGERGAVLSDDQRREVIARLEPLAHVSTATKAEHVEQVEAAKSGSHRSGGRTR